MTNSLLISGAVPEALRVFVYGSVGDVLGLLLMLILTSSVGKDFTTWTTGRRCAVASARKTIIVLQGLYWKSPLFFKT